MTIAAWLITFVTLGALMAGGLLIWANEGGRGPV